MSFASRSVAFIAATTLLLTLAACGGAKGSDAGSSSTSSSAAGSNAASPNTGTATATGTGTPTGSIIVAITEPTHLTPGRQSGSSLVLINLFSPLTTTDSIGKISYVQAASVTSPDATTWTIKLKPGWTFHNGEPVTSNSYVDAWNYVAYGPNAWENSNQLSEIVGFAALNPKSGTPTTKTLSGLKVVEPLTFTVKLSSPNSQFPLELSQLQTAFYPMPKAAYTDLKAYDRKPIGNGPFALTDAWKDNTKFTATAYAKYQGPKPTVGQMTFQPYNDADTAYTDVQAGNADIALVPADKMTSVKADFAGHYFAAGSQALNYLGLPLNDPRFKDIRVREAISMSIDRKAVSNAIYGGLLQPATALTPPAMIGSPGDICGQYCTYDPTAAKALLAAAGGFSGKMEVFYPGGFGFDGLMQAYANQIRQNLGIADVIATPSTDFASYLSSAKASTLAGPHWGNWGATYPSQQNTLRNLFTATGEGNVYTGYSNATVDALLATADSATTSAAASAGYVAVQKRVLQDFPIIPTFFGNNIYVASSKVKNLPSVAGYPVPSQIVLN